jgi:hypothetical protein
MSLEHLTHSPGPVPPIEPPMFRPPVSPPPCPEPPLLCVVDWSSSSPNSVGSRSAEQALAARAADSDQQKKEERATTTSVGQAA